MELLDDLCIEFHVAIANTGIFVETAARGPMVLLVIFMLKRQPGHKPPIAVNGGIHRRH